MNKNRLEAFSDGVLAIIVTIMVLEMKAPRGAEWDNLSELIPKFISYLFIFIMVWIYWNNHHHLFQTVHKVNGKVLLANGFLLFCLSLQPFVTAWMGENHFARNPVILMAGVLLLSAIAYTILTFTLIKLHGSDSVLRKAIESDKKGKISTLAYVIAIPLAFIHPLISCGIFGFVAIMWLIPDTRIEKALKK
ncbi:MAG: hypothetical protein FD155_2696 [Bacteroidetes bacterium]|nr:MAG: hypothetical protein FD155_2696 [Bacteroidota bacterium]